MDFPTINPVAFSIFGFDVHWYGLAYVASFMLGLKYIERAFNKVPAHTNIRK